LQHFYFIAEFILHVQTDLTSTSLNRRKKLLLFSTCDHTSFGFTHLDTLTASAFVLS